MKRFVISLFFTGLLALSWIPSSVQTAEFQSVAGLHSRRAPSSFPVKEPQAMRTAPGIVWRLYQP
jgi:hypothetical protein